MGPGGHADGSRRARTWKPAGTQMEAGIKIHISDYRYTVFERKVALKSALLLPYSMDEGS